MSALATCRADLEALLQSHKLDRTLVPVGGRMGWSAPETASCGVVAVDRHLGGGLPVGQFSEIVGPRSSGRTSLLMSMLATATQRDDRVALIDAFDTFDPESAAATGVELRRMLWVRGDGSTPAFPFLGSRQSGTERAIDRALKATNLILQAGGFGVVALDLADAPATALRRIPLTTWKRLQRVLDGQQTVGVVVGNMPMSRSAGGVSLVLRPASTATRVPGQWALSMPSHVFQGLDTEMRVLRVQRVSGAEDRPVRMTAAARVA
jgi:hypothetical protein